MMDLQKLRESFTSLNRPNWEQTQALLRTEAFKRWDVACHYLGLNPVRAQIGKGRVAGTGSGNFFFPPAGLPRLGALLNATFPGLRDQLREQAERICAHQFDLLGYPAAQYGNPIDWRLDAVNGKRAPNRPWYALRVQDFSQVGDARVIWALNRHQHLVTLARAYRLTGEERFASEVFQQWDHWRRQNPYPMGLNWASTFEVALRALAWLWMGHLLEGSLGMPAVFKRDLLQALAVHGRHLELYNQGAAASGVYAIAGGVALFFIGTLCPPLQMAARWQQMGWQILLRESATQVRPDGLHRDGSVRYHVYVLDMLLHARILAGCNGIGVGAAFDDLLLGMLEALHAIGQAGAPPLLGEDDGGRLFDPLRKMRQHLLDPLATGAALYERADFKAAAGGLREETLWLLGAKGAARFNSLGAPKAAPASTRLESSGLYVMLGSETAAAAGAPRQQLIVAAGPSRPPGAALRHADALSVHLSEDSVEWLLDPGAAPYAGSPAAINAARSTAAHNPVTVDHRDQAAAGPDGTAGRLPEVQVERWVAGETFDLFTGSHSGYLRLDPPLVHRRTVFNLKSHFWLVRDVLIGQGNHEVDIYWHLAPDLAPVYAAPAFLFLPAGLERGADERRGLAFLPLEGHGWTQEMERGRYSPVYGAEEPAPVLHFHRRASLPADFTVLLAPAASRSATVGSFARLEDEKLYGKDEVPPVRGYKYVTDGAWHYFFFAAEAKAWRLGPWSSDADFLYCRTGQKDGSTHWAVCNGTFVEISGQRVNIAAQAMERWECVISREGTRVYCSDPSSLKSRPAEDMKPTAERVSD